MYVYPNPVENIANVVIEHDKPLAPLDVQMYVYDLSGRLIYQESNNLITDDKKRKTTKSTKIFVQKQ